MLASHGLPRSKSYIGDTTSRFHEHHLAGERASTRVVLICRSFAAAKFKPAIRMRRSSRPWIAWMEYFGSANEFCPSALGRCSHTPSSIPALARAFATALRS